MAVKPLGNGQWMGLYADARPTGIPTNALYWAYNVGLTEIYNGSAWIPFDRPISNDYNYKVYLDGANTRLVSLNNMATDTSNSDAKVVFDAMAALSGGPTIKGMPGTYLFSDSWNCVDRNFKFVGSRVAMNGNAGQTGDTILKANFDHATKPVINEINLNYSKQQFKDIVIDCDFRVAYGIDAANIKELMPWLENVAAFNADIDGVSLADTTYVSILNPIFARNAGAGLHFKGPTSTEKVNTTLVQGGRITTNGYNIRTTGYCIGNQIEACVLEQNNDYLAFTNSVRWDSNSVRDNVVRDCSMEYAGAVSKELIYDNGWNNRFENIRFGAAHTSYVPIRFGPTSKHSLLANPQITANNANTMASIIQDAGAISNRVVNPAATWSTPTDVQVKNAAGKNTLMCSGLPLHGFHAIDAYLPLISNQKWGFLALGTGLITLGLFQGWTQVVTGGSGPFVAAENGRPFRFPTGANAGDNGGYKTTGTFMSNAWNPRFLLRFRVVDNANSRVYIGWNNNGTDPSGDDPLNTLNGAYFGKISTNADWVFMHNDGGAGATIIDPDLNIAADNNIHTLYMENEGATIYWQLDNNDLQKITTDVPASGSVYCPIFEIETVTAGIKNFDIFECDMRCF